MLGQTLENARVTVSESLLALPRNKVLTAAQGHSNGPQEFLRQKVASGCRGCQGQWGAAKKALCTGQSVVVDPIDDVLVEGLLAAKVLTHRIYVGAGGFRDCTCRGAFIASLGEQVGRCKEDLLGGSAHKLSAIRE